MPYTMELMQSDEMMTRYNTYDLSSGSARTRWYMKKNNVRVLALSLTIILVAAGIFLAGYYYGLAVLKRSSESIEHEPVEPVVVTEPSTVEIFTQSTVPTEPSTVVTTESSTEVITESSPVVWNGTCPETPSKCPNRFHGVPPLLLVSLDGFKPDYLDENLTPTLAKLSKCGTSAPFMYPVYPSKTFCSHFSQVTGLYPASHGIVDNSMYDPIKKAFFRPGTADSFWWEKDPIWTTLEKQGKTTALYFWPGADIEINGILPTHYKKYDTNVPFERRVDQVLEWLNLPASERPTFLTMYFNEPDTTAHRYGTNASQTKEVVARVDKMIDRLLSGLQQRGIIGCINIMIMSDHGMSNIECDRVIEIEDYVNVTDMYSSLSTIGRLRPNSTEEIENIVSQLECKNDHMRVYKKEELPVRFHYAEHPRIEPIIINLDPGWTITSVNKSSNKMKYCAGGAHGYDNLHKDMRAIFMAYGPSFKKSTIVKPFINTELYELMSELVNITANPNNGTKGSLHHLLSTFDPLSEQESLQPPPIGQIANESDEYSFLVYASGCKCRQTFSQTMVDNITISNALHFPFGIPHSSEMEAKLKLLYHEDYVSAFDIKYRLAMWSSFNLNGLEVLNISEKICWVGDSRVEKVETSECQDYENEIVKNENILQRPLYPPYFSDNVTLIEEASYVTNSVPKHVNHTEVLEERFYEILNEWALESEINVVMGPAFDLDATGLKPDVGTIMKTHAKFGPLVVPTHYFAVVTWCDDMMYALNSCDPSHLETTAFLLPNIPFPQNCETPNNIIAKNVARVVDIEKLTGISFFTELPVYDAIRLRTMVPTRVPR